MRRGEIWWADLEPRSGSEQRGRRPVVVISSDGFNRTESWRSVIVVPLSSSSVARKVGPTGIRVSAGAGLRRESVALCHQVTTLDRGKLVERIGRLAPAALDEVGSGLLRAVDLWSGE